MKAYFIGGQEDLTCRIMTEAPRLIEFAEIPRLGYISVDSNGIQNATFKVLTYILMCKTDNDNLIYELVNH